MKKQIVSTFNLLRSFFAAIFYGAAYAFLWVCDFLNRIAIYLDPNAENDN